MLLFKTNTHSPAILRISRRLPHSSKDQTGLIPTHSKDSDQAYQTPLIYKLPIHTKPSETPYLSHFSDYFPLTLRRKYAMIYSQRET